MFLVGLVGFEPAIFTQNKASLEAFFLTGFFTAPELLHPKFWSVNPLLLSGALNG
jgi:hypothetical protein